MKRNQVQRGENVDRFIAKSKFETERAIQLGLEKLPSVNGPYLSDPTSGRVVASPKSSKYRDILYGGQGK
jgi:hypothetical protein